MTEEQNYNLKKKLPIGRNEDVEFSQEAADEDDLEAQRRAALADKRNEKV